MFEAAAEESYQNGWSSSVYSYESAHKDSIPVEYTTQGFSTKKIGVSAPVGKGGPLE